MITQPAGRPLEMWGGIECTVNRVGDEWFDQLELSGHARRLGDLDRCASLGIGTLRYPLLWERIEPSDQSDDSRWHWADERMQKLRDLEIEPIVGLLHHGSGPRFTNLLDPAFPRLFAAFARRVAERYPWIGFVTPINEPLTTARFSALYGHWYPHARSASQFAFALLNQGLAIRAAMDAMREVNPAIQLVQTEDLGRTYATPALSYQADFDNLRRWLTFDLLCGRVTRDHGMHGYLAATRDTQRALDDLTECPCKPSLVGINYYVTSERFLDDRVWLHDERNVGCNYDRKYADVEAVRSLEAGIAGHRRILNEAWSRYQIPVALTEVHLGCTREQQMRWLREAWEGALAARSDGGDVRAVTAWALFGSFGWESLVTRKGFAYECGAFDVRGRVPRPTALAAMIRDLPRNLEPDAVSTDVGWWREPARLSVRAPASVEGSVLADRPAATVFRRRFTPPILITGANGTLATALVRVAQSRGLQHVALARRDLDICDEAQVRSAIDRHRPWAIINAAGYVRVHDAERECLECRRINVSGAATLAGAASAGGLQFVTFSSDLVFDGASTRAYVESDRIRPLNVYGSSKAVAESRCMRAHPDALIVRTSAFFGPWDSFNFAVLAAKSMIAGIPFEAASDCTVSPTYVPDLAHAVLDLLVDREHGLWHLSNEGSISWADLALEVADRARVPRTLVRAVPAAELGFTARMPRNSTLSSERGKLLPSLDAALSRFATDARIAEHEVALSC